MTIDEATEILRSAPPSYQFPLALTRPWLKTSDVSSLLGVTTRMFNSWLNETPGLIAGAYQIPGGWNLPREGLIIFVARFYQNLGNLDDIKKAAGH